MTAQQTPTPQASQPHDDSSRDVTLRLQLALESSYAIAFEWDVARDEVRRLYSTDPTLWPTSNEMLTTFAAVRQAVHPADREVFERNVRAAFDHPQGRYTSEYRLLREDGAVSWLAETGQVEFDAERRPVSRRTSPPARRPKRDWR